MKLVKIKVQRGLDNKFPLKEVVMSAGRVFSVSALFDGFISLSKGSYDAESLLSDLCREHKEGFYLFFVSAELTHPALDLVYGYYLNNCAVLSLKHLGLKEQVVLESLHELGHLLGLKHCSNPSCFMCFSDNSNSRSLILCPACKKIIG